MTTSGSSNSGSNSQGNIFFNTENLAFSLPLILVCVIYVSQKYCQLWWYTTKLSNHLGNYIVAGFAPFFLTIFSSTKKAYFKLIPLKYGVPPILGVAVILLLRRQIQTQRDRKLQNMDQADINDLALELQGPDDDNKNGKNVAKNKHMVKKKDRTLQRLAAERKKEGNQKAAKNVDDEDDTDITTFAKGSKNNKKRN
jgi:hypothetical protein